MFYQVFVPAHQRSFLRFLWWENNDLDSQPSDYEMNVHVFGATSSPSCCNYALRRTALDNWKEFGSDVSSTLLRNFYVDDMLKSKDETTKTISHINGVRNLCKKGGFNLTKFVSNNSVVLQTIPDEDLGSSVKDASLVRKLDLTDRALGVSWNLSNDVFRFVLGKKDKPATRRGILSTISSIYDPLGLIAPFLLQGRLILQRLCCQQHGWDDEVPPSIANEWAHWYIQLKSIEGLNVPRCFKPSKFGEIINRSLHHFSDASEKGYGQVTYLRQINRSGSIHCSLVIGKSRVTPMKFVSIPRLELSAAVLSTKMAELMVEELDLGDIKQIFWTDSQVVLSYLQNTSKRFKTFVANRVQMIKSSSIVENWHYIQSSENPADLASRGIMTSEVSKIERWFNGPSFLWKHEETWDRKTEHLPIESNDPELKKVNATRQPIENRFVTLTQRISSWSKLRRITAWILRFITASKRKKGVDYQHELTTEETNTAGQTIIRLIQEVEFKHEMTTIKSISSIGSSNRLASLNPFVDDSGLLRVGGRLKRSDLSPESMHPILLPKNHHLSKIVILWCHIITCHGGRSFTLNELRARGFWVVHGNNAVRKIIFRCVTCRYLRGKSSVQVMADLPKDRVTQAPPFTYVGVDFFGPFHLKENRKEFKRYGVIFTCFGCRAVHLEIAYSLETDTFILALRRFIARRGQVRNFYSDNGTNFVGANNELRQAVKNMDRQKIHDYLINHDADWEWKFNPPASSHMGGVWERHIRSIRSILASLMKCHSTSFNTEGLHTLLTEIEGIINSRPLTVDMLSDVTSPSPLSPINLLTMKSKVVLPPPGKFESADMYSRKRWRRVQHISNEFWVRWRKEYLQSLQTRNKWKFRQRDFVEGDIVILKDSTLSDQRNHWPIGRIDSTFHDKDGRVRFVDVYIAKTKQIYRRPISKLVLLVEKEGPIPDEEP